MNILFFTHSHFFQVQSHYWHQFLAFCLSFLLWTIEMFLVCFISFPVILRSSNKKMASALHSQANPTRVSFHWPRKLFNNLTDVIPSSTDVVYPSFGTLVPETYPDIAQVIKLSQGELFHPVQIGQSCSSWIPFWWLYHRSWWRAIWVSRNVDSVGVDEKSLNIYQ